MLPDDCDIVVLNQDCPVLLTNFFPVFYFSSRVKYLTVYMTKWRWKLNVLESWIQAVWFLYLEPVVLASFWQPSPFIPVEGFLSGMPLRELGDYSKFQERKLTRQLLVREPYKIKHSCKTPQLQCKFLLSNSKVLPVNNGPWGLW